MRCLMPRHAQMLSLFGLLTLFSACTAPSPPAGQVTPQTQLFSTTQAPQAGVVAPNKRQRTATPNAGVLGELSQLQQQLLAGTDQATLQRAIDLALFPDVTYRATIDHVEQTTPTIITWSGHLDTNGTFTLSLDNDGIFGSIRAPNAYYEIQGSRTAVTIVERDFRMFKQGGTPLRPKRAAATVVPNTPQEDGSVIDVLMLYTPSARAAAAMDAGASTGSNAPIQRIIATSVADTNQAYQNSGVIQRIHLTAMLEIPYSKDQQGQERLSTILQDLTNNGDHELDAAHGVRDQTRSDIVALLVVNNNEGGLANAMDDTNNDAGFEVNAFAVISWDTAVGNEGVAHELGHVMGADHDRENTDTRGVYPYSYGYRFSYQGKTYHTIMAYRPGEIILNFANPDVKYPNSNGVPTGVPEGQAQPCNVAKTFNNTRMLVANFRTRAHP
jgi:hypothetical protein